MPFILVHLFSLPVVVGCQRQLLSASRPSCSGASRTAQRILPVRTFAAVKYVQANFYGDGRIVFSRALRFFKFNRPFFSGLKKKKRKTTKRKRRKHRRSSMTRTDTSLLVRRRGRRWTTCTSWDTTPARSAAQQMPLTRWNATRRWTLRLGTSLSTSTSCSTWNWRKRSVVNKLQLILQFRFTFLGS